LEAQLKNFITKFENVIKDIRSLIAAQMPDQKQPAKKETPPKMHDPRPARKNSPQKTISKSKVGSKLERMEKTKEKSMTDSQGETKFQGSSYNGKGRVDQGKIRSNKKRR
jgi:hypothetical protein